MLKVGRGRAELPAVRVSISFVEAANKQTNKQTGHEACRHVTKDVTGA